MRSFIATTWAVSELPELDAVVIVLAESNDGSGSRLEIQRALSFDEQDRKLGQDTYCLSTEDGACCYGGVLSWSLRNRSLEIVLSASASAALGAEGGFRVSVGEDALRPIEAGLRRIFS